MSALPFTTLRLDKATPGAIAPLATLSEEFYTPVLPGLPPMQGGWMGWFGYELGGCFERVPAAQFNEFQLPVAALGLYDCVLSWDTELDQGWLISQGWPIRDPRKRSQHAYRRLQTFCGILESPPQQLDPLLEAQRQFTLPAGQLAPQHQTRWSDDWTSNFSAAGFRECVARGVEYIRAGDIFQVNLAQRLVRRAFCRPEVLYEHLRQANPNPFGGYADFGRTQVLSCSPERFLKIEGREVEARPIKGTRPRLTNPTADVGMGQLLLDSSKDRSENVMIVDLLRNDLSRVADPESVHVEQLCGLERYPYVWHLVSVLKAKLRDGVGATDVLHATFPGGSITGAPKIRAMEIIAELEPTARGPYCGSLGYISFAGDIDLSILIRTLTSCGGWWQVPVGGGIVVDSDPSLEEQETWHKAEGILHAIESLPSKNS